MERYIAGNHLKKWFRLPLSLQLPLVDGVTKRRRESLNPGLKGSRMRTKYMEIHMTQARKKATTRNTKKTRLLGACALEFAHTSIRNATPTIAGQNIVKKKGSLGCWCRRLGTRSEREYPAGTKHLCFPLARRKTQKISHISPLLTSTFLPQYQSLFFLSQYI